MNLIVMHNVFFVEDVMTDKPPSRKTLPQTSHEISNTTEGNECSKQPSSSTESSNKNKESCESNVIQIQPRSPSLITNNDGANVSPIKQRLVLKRLPYSRSEQQQIVDYIISTKSYKYIKGNQLWQEMQKDNTVCKGRRTWQSMKENFHKQIVPQLHIYKNVNEKVANCFKRVLMGLNLDLDSDSNEEKENSPKKKVITKDKYAMNMSDTSESENETSVSIKKLQKYQPQEINKLSRSPGRKQAFQSYQRYDYKARKKRRSLPMYEGDTTEEEDFDNLSRRSLPKTNPSASIGSIQNSIARSSLDFK